MSKKVRLDFETLYGLYRDNKLEQARNLLYENMDRFLTSGKVNLDYWMQYGYDDIKQDMYMYIDDRILSSIEKGFSSRETFSYVRCRVRNTLLNFVNPKRSWNNIKYLKDYWDITEERQEDNVIHASSDRMLVNDAVLSLPETQKKIMLLKYYSWDDIWLLEISKHIWKPLYQVVIEHWTALNEIRGKMWIFYEMQDMPIELYQTPDKEE